MAFEAGEFPKGDWEVWEFIIPKGGGALLAAPLADVKGDAAGVVLPKVGPGAAAVAPKPTGFAFWAVPPKTGAAFGTGPDEAPSSGLGTLYFEASF